jgi:hypothetical protein
MLTTLIQNTNIHNREKKRKRSIIIVKMCQVLRSDIFSLILIINILSIVKDNISKDNIIFELQSLFYVVSKPTTKIIDVVLVFSINAIQGKSNKI